MTVYAAVTGNRLDLKDDTTGALVVFGSIVVTGPTTVQLPVADYGRPGALSAQQRPAPQLWDGVIEVLGYDVVGEWHAQNLTRDELLWHAEIEAASGVTYAVAGTPPVLTVTGATTISDVLTLVLSARVQVGAPNPRIATITPS